MMRIMRFGVAARWLACVVLATAGVLAMPSSRAADADSARVLDTFEDLSPWKLVVSDDVEGRIVASQAPQTQPPEVVRGGALRLEFDFNGKAGWAMAQRPLPLELPQNFEIVLQVRGDARPNDLQFKLSDASGENVWWFRKPDYVVPKEWETLRIRKRDIEFAWGPSKDHELRRSAALEVGFAAGHGGGSGAIEIAGLSLEALPPQAPEVRVPTPNEMLTELAKKSPRGAFPRAFVGEQSYWTIVGVDGGAEEGMLSEDGAFELRKAAPSLEPFVTVDGVDYDWSRVSTSQRLQDRYLPMPVVRWSAPGWQLDIEAFGAGERGGDYAVVRYDYSNLTRREQSIALAIMIRPMQVNPPTQFLNGVGGAAPIRELRWDGSALEINRTNRVLPLIAPDLFVAKSFEAAPTPQRLLKETAAASELVDDSGFASGAFVYRRKVPAGASMSFAMVVPWSADLARMSGVAQAQNAVSSQASNAWLEATQQTVAASWHESLDRVTLRGPASMQPVLDTLKTALAHVLINRDGPGLQPGSRSYERSWIRDGALSSAALLRLGHAPVAREFFDWYSGFLFSNGKVPCCVDFRGADPVPENDSVGEFIWLAAELDRYTADAAALERNWPRIEAAFGYMEKLRLSQRTSANRGTPYYGLLPASISHEGYSAKPMHSYWDDFWALAGYDSAVRMARDLGKRDLASRWAKSRDQFRRDVHASIVAAMKMHRIDYIPGCAELGDFDATSTTIAMSPIGEESRLPQRQLRNTFERYWLDFKGRRDGTLEWSAYTPYEVRTIGSFLRLGWRDRADELLDYFMRDRRPAAWNQWAEVVGRVLREPRFIGDMPHGWVASDFIRSVLDMFAYERESDEALVLAAGIDPNWLGGEGVAVEKLRTPWGLLSYSLRRDESGRIKLVVAAGVRPPGGIVLALNGVERRLKNAPLDQTFEVGHER